MGLRPFRNVFRAPVLAALMLIAPFQAVAAAATPNVVVLLADDLGVGDLGMNGSPIRTPNLDRLATEGAYLTHFYASANVCTPSRAGLLTGRYPIRMGLAYKVVEPDSTHGLPDRELTLAELLHGAGYATALVGKWHLGHADSHWPTAHGFEHFFGLLYSNDMQPLALYRGREIVEEPVDQRRLTRRFTDEGLYFIRENRDRPFFLYLAYTAPHIPLAVMSDRAGISPAGLYGDVVEELDFSVGKILDALAEEGVAGNTLVIFTSDNGAWFEGSNEPFRDGKGLPLDGGYRVPFVARFPDVIPAGVRSDAIAMNIDVLPTVSAATGVALPSSLQLDGRDILPVLKGGTESPHEMLLLFQDEDIGGLRTQRWKFLLRTWYRENYVAFDRFGQALGFEYTLLFDMQAKHPERYSQAARHPKVVRDLQEAVREARSEFDPLRTRPKPRVVP
jgi:uncharacterized sulfatase